MSVKNPREVVELYDQITSLFPRNDVALSTLFDISLTFFSLISDEDNIKFCMNELNGYPKDDLKNITTEEDMVKRINHRVFYLRPYDDNIISKDTKIPSLYYDSIGEIEYEYHNVVINPIVINEEMAAIDKNGKMEVVRCFANYHSLFFIINKTKAELRRRIYSDNIRALMKDIRTLSLEGIHPKLIERCGDQFANAKYLDAIRQADALLEEVIRQDTKDNTRATGQILRDLFTWKTKTPPIRFAKQDKPHWEEVHDGIVFLALAMTNLSRKNHMHENRDINANDCYALLWNYTMILNSIDNAK
jgi:hypothetical protein